MLSQITADFTKLIPFVSRPFRSGFVPSRITRELDIYKNDLDALTKYLKKYKVIIERHPLENAVTVGGEFCESGRIYLRLFGDYVNYVFTDEEWAMFKFRLVQVLMHELIHWSQYSIRGHGESKICRYVSTHHEASYYSLHDEIEAFAHCMFLEMKRNFPDESIKEVMTHYVGETYEHAIEVVFENNPENKAVNKYRREILKWEKLYNT